VLIMAQAVLLFRVHYQCNYLAFSGGAAAAAAAD